ncbi:MAG: HD domain-containing protein [Bacillota bacterium]|nr:HD domain-containing protein [Bacillota bacterium]
MKIKSCDENIITEILSDYTESDGTDIMKKYSHHADVSTYDHAMNVVYASYKMSKKFRLRVDVKSLVVGAYLHDYYLYDCHHNESRGKFHGFRHPKVALQNAEDHYDLNDKERNIIESHMWPLTITKFPKSKEAVLICLADKYCALGEMMF